MIAALLLVALAAQAPTDDDAWVADPTDAPEARAALPTKKTQPSSSSWDETPKAKVKKQKPVKQSWDEDSPSPALVVGAFSGGAMVAGTAVTLGVSVANFNTGNAFYYFLGGVVLVPFGVAVVAAGVGALFDVGFEAGAGSVVGIFAGAAAGALSGAAIGGGFEMIVNANCPGCSPAGQLALVGAVVGLAVGIGVGTPIGAIVGARLGE